MSTRPISRQNALKLSAWLATQHPEFFRQLAVQVRALQRSPLGRLGYFGDDSSVSADLSFTPDTTVTVDSGTVDSSASGGSSGIDYSSLESTAALTPDLTSVGVDAATGSSADAITSAVSAPSTDASTADTSQSSGSFWSGIGSGISGAASAVGSVASALMSPATLAAAGTAAAAYFSAQGKSAQTSAQNAVLQAQLSRTAAGAAPAPISYVRNATTGQLQPVYASNSGYQSVTGSLLNQLTNPATVGTSSVGGIPTVYLIGGGIALAIVLALLASRK